VPNLGPNSERAQEKESLFLFSLLMMLTFLPISVRIASHCLGPTRVFTDRAGSAQISGQRPMFVVSFFPLTLPNCNRQRETQRELTNHAHWPTGSFFFRLIHLDLHLSLSLSLCVSSIATCAPSASVAAFGRAARLDELHPTGQLDLELDESSHNRI